MRQKATRKKARKPSQYVDGALKDYIEVLALRGWKAPAIYESVAKALGEKRVPHLRTIQRWVDKVALQDPSADWQLAEAAGEDAALVLPVLAALIEASEGRLKVISNAKAEWIVRLRRVADDLPPWTIYELAHTYLLRHERHDGTDDLDAFLAFAPWRSKENDRRYYGLMKRLGMVMYTVLSGGSVLLRESADDITYADLLNLSELTPSTPGETEQQEQKGAKS